MTLDKIEQLYSESLRRHGAAPPGVGWRDPQSHELRFAKLCALLPAPSEGPLAVNDLGCGYGALYEYLQNRSYRLGAFHGYDISAPMLEQARQRIGRADGVTLHQTSTLGSDADYSFASGIFNVRMDANEEAWTAHILATLDNLHERSARGFAFNLLTSYVDWKEPHLYYGDPLRFFDHCKRRYSPRVALLHDYALWEWTMIVRR